MCCPSWCAPKPRTPNYEISVAVQPRPVTVSRSVQPSVSVPSSPSTVESRSIAAAHSRFASTDQISLMTVLRSGPSRIASAIPEEETQKVDDKKTA